MVIWTAWYSCHRCLKRMNIRDLRVHIARGGCARVHFGPQEAHTYD